MWLQHLASKIIVWIFLFQKNVAENKPDDLLAPRHNGFVHYLYILWIIPKMECKSSLLINESQIYILNHFVWQTPQKKQNVLNSI